MFEKFGKLFGRDRAARAQGENDAPTEAGTDAARPTGGGSDVGTQDANSTTGTTTSDTFVGRAGSDETGDTGMSGAEARGDGEDLDHQGAARRE
jgi:hypothetical protein